MRPTGQKIETQTEEGARGLLTDLQRSASVYNTIQNRGEKEHFSRCLAFKVKPNEKSLLCVYFTVHIYTQTNDGQECRMGLGWVHVMGYGY